MFRKLALGAEPTGEATRRRSVRPRLATVRPRPRSVISLLFVAPLVAVTACSGDGDQSQRVEAGDTEAAIAALQAAPDAAAEAGSGRMAMTVGFEVDGEPFELSTTGVFTGTQAQMEMDFGALLAAQAPNDELPPGFDEPMIVVVDGARTYMRMPMLDALTGTSGWLSMTPEDLGLASDALGMGFGPSNNPIQMMEALRGISDDLEELGTEEVRGEPTTHYRAVVDLERAVEQVPEALQPLIEAQLGALGSTLPVEVWLGDDGLVRRISMDMAKLLAIASAGSGQAMEGGAMVIEYFDYGADIEVDIPDPEDTIPFLEVLGGLQGGS
jgi:hypothetical protein